jgi:methionyl-tRNA formyltransferase
LIPNTILSVPRIGTLNLHPAFLPYNRGWHTPTWAIAENTPYGATLHWVDEGMDTGPIAMQREIDVSIGETAHSLYRRVLDAEYELLRDALPLLVENQLPRIPQDGKATQHRKSDIEALRKLELSDAVTIGDLLRRLRALTTSRWDEAAWFEHEGVRYRVRLEMQREDSVARGIADQTKAA